MAKRRIEDEMSDAIREVVEEREIAIFEAAQDAFENELVRNNGLEFVWEGAPADGNSLETMEKAFTLAERKEFWDKYKTWGLTDLFYISDFPIGEGDSRSLGNKYDGDRKLLRERNTYYLNQI